MIRVTPLGAAGEVTGSGYLVETPSASVLVELGLFQGAAADEARNADLRPLDPRALQAVLLTHAHIDHSGRLPLLAAAGYRRPVWATPATKALAEILIQDSAKLQDEDARRENRVRRRAGLPEIAPLYGPKEAARLARLVRGLPCDVQREVAPGVRARFFEAGHILGSASLELALDDAGRERIVVFSGDLGSPGQPILRDPVRPARADLVFLESTYGDRNHPPRAESVDAFVEIVRDAARRKARVLVPAFAVGRTQLLLYHLAEAVRARRVPKRFPIYLDSPTGTRATEVYRRHQELYDEETRSLVRSGEIARDLASLRIVESAEQSRALNDSGEACVIIAGSGMCDGGRIRHHLKHNLWREGTAVVIAGYMAEGTLGRRLAEGERRVEILGDTIAVRAAIHVLPGFSAHAGQDELVDWLADVAPSRPRLALTHGEEGPRAALAARVRERYGLAALLPSRGEPIELR
ncbi:MAG TPA: MBL fold metallo-hydrolase [Myxococcota bacterium]|nr:MBL fold metallo-hydrolase [Myxococcota bacterium]